MADAAEKPTATGRIAGWIKAAVGSLAGLVGGAALMYVSPLVDRVVKPAKPIANFQYEAQGLKVTFQNHSTGGHDGWWDFGDGSALEPFAAEQTSVTHLYLKPGTYTAKLSLRNLVNEENERTVSVALDGISTTPPSIDSLVMMPVLNDYAPATFRALTKVSGATQCVWALSDRPIEITADTANGSQERFYTFKDPGTYTVKLAASNGKQTVEQSAKVVIKSAPLGTVMASVSVSYQAVQVEHRAATPWVRVDLAANKVQFSKDTPTANGWDLVKAELVTPCTVANLKAPPQVQLSADKKKYTISGELLKPAPSVMIPLAVEEQRVSAVQTKVMDPMGTTLTVPGSTTVPLPRLADGWACKDRKITLILAQDGKQVKFAENELPNNAVVQLSSGGLFVVTATVQGDQLRLDLREVKNAWNMFAN
jgi:PKD repeat protein